ncbi:3-keto-disaccharide hydrolase [Luteolibacter marinus]|uniref:3-keto-disaccharide hydrolase n=1 Tax=Luteolibacter marinus TaxID=2776705 RepID=UPI001867D92F|nr:DUF1080 domain-containing protein [Luteolibacter marinus]
MKSSLRLLALAALLLSPARGAEEKWTAIFNGKDLTGWTPKIRGLAYGEDPKKTFIVEDGVLKVSYANYSEWGETYGHLFYGKKLSNYRLRLEYRVVGEQIKGGPGWALQNNGIMLHCQDPKTMGKDQSFPVSLEFQLLGAGNGVGTTGNLCTPGTFVTIGGAVNKNHCISCKQPAFPPGEWVTAEAEVHGGKLIRHLINGKVAFEYTDTKLDPADGDAKPLIEALGGDALTEGYISLQSESHPYEFRKIEVMELAE